MTLLDVVRRLPHAQVIVAHVNHGIRKDATEDANMVRHIAMSHNLQYEEIDLALGENTSEEEARKARYDFLRHLRKKYNAIAIITAHHRDDMLETAIINMLRGTGWRGLSSLRSTPEIIRPFLAIPKVELVEYAKVHNLQWRHDSTNDDTRYLRNRVRHTLVPKMSQKQRDELYQYIVRQNDLTAKIDDEARLWLEQNVISQNFRPLLPRYPFIMMPQHVAHELLQTVLRRTVGKSATRPLVDRALLFVKVAKAHKTFPIDSNWQLRALPRKVIVLQRVDMLSLDNAGVRVDQILNEDTRLETETTK
jgi:tRNA(Ile)-lysidine synthase